MDYYETFKAEAETLVAPLAVKVRTLAKRRETCQSRIRDTRQDLERRTAALASHRARAGERLSKSSSSFAEWQGRLRRLGREHESTQEALALLESELDPATERELTEARKNLQQALDALRNAAKVPCEAKMGALLASIVAEHDAYLAAWSQVYRDFGASFGRGGRGIRPVARSTRLGTVAGRSDKPRWVTFTDKPAVPPAVPGGVESTPAPEVAPGVAEAPQDAPEATSGPRRLLSGRKAEGAVT